MFLFHTGSIKSVYRRFPCHPMSSFYSILVRLKGTRVHIEISEKISFYSILVRLKGPAQVSVAHSDNRFLFHTGSIKSPKKPAERCLKISFYSILVRLKG